MVKRWTLLLAVFVSFGVSWASQPGQPLDCSDWVFLEPGHACSILIDDCYSVGTGPTPVFGPPGMFCAGDLTALDNEGRLYIVSSRDSPLGYCGSTALYRTELRRLDGANAAVVAHVDDRCGPDNTVDFVFPFDGSQQEGDPPMLLFDPNNGRMLIPLQRDCASGGGQPDRCTYHHPPSMVAIGGFATSFEIMQTYMPVASLAFRVPAHPEGLRAADHFDTYWGHVSDLPDFTRAKPVQCDYPKGPHSVGEYLTVPDTSPRPAPGHVNYVVTAVTYGAERRYGRQRIGGVLSGRDPALLPPCPVAVANATP